jgi:hypothetical protein
MKILTFCAIWGAIEILEKILKRHITPSVQMPFRADIIDEQEFLVSSKCTD